MNGKRASGGGSENALAEAFRHAPEPMAVTGTDGAIQHANRALTELFGRDAAELTGRPWFELLDSADVEQGTGAHQDALAGNWHRRSRLRLAVTDKSSRLAEVRLRPVDGDADLVPGDPSDAAVVVLLHVLSTEETDLRVVGELRTDNSDSVLWSLDLSNGRLRELFGPTPLGGLLAGNDRELERILERIHPDDNARVRDAMAASFAGRDYEQRFRIFDRLGDERSLHVRARFVPGQPDRLVGIIDDVTEHVQLVRRLADRRRTEAEHGRLVTELSSKLVSATTVDKVMDLLSEEFLPIFGGVYALALYVEEGLLRTSPSARERGNTHRIDGRRADDTDFPMGAVIQDRQPRFFESRAEIASRFPAAVDLMRSARGQAWATVPIFGDGKIALGVWQMVWDRPHHASRDERALMLTFAGLAGQALQRIKAQQAELELADAVQRRMLPRQVASFPDMDIATKYLPSRAEWRICGDFYDVIELPDNKVGLLVGDVQGHGVEAAAAMGQIRVAFRAYASNQSDPGVVLGETNRLLTETGEIVFATCGYLVVDRASGVMQAAWAGQPPAVLATQGTYELWSPETGPPLGVLADTEYTVTTRVLAPGTTLLLCSDGLVESSDVTMQDGLAQVGEALAQHGEDPNAAAQVLAEMAPAGRGDDIALLITRMIPRATPPPEQAESPENISVHQG